MTEFYGHSRACPDGWGLAVFRGNSVSLEKEPVKASKSVYLAQRLSWDVKAKNLFAHIRKATIGFMDYSNCHPFVWDDGSGRTWTLMHNGTLFDSGMVLPYRFRQEGTTDSEGILLHLVDRIDRETERTGRVLSAEERFRLIDEIVVRLAEGNKLNLFIYDGEQMYLHTNQKGTLYIRSMDGCSVFSTKPLTAGDWEPVGMNRLLAFRDGEQIFSGTKHDFEFFEEDHDLSLLYAAFSGL